MFLNWRLRCIDTSILAVGFCTAGIIVRRVEKRVTMWFLNRWMWNSIVLDRKIIIWQLFGPYVYNRFFVVATEVGDLSADVGVRLRAVKTLLTKINSSLPKWNVLTTLRSVSTVFYRLKPFQAGLSSEKGVPRFTFPKQRSFHFPMISLILLRAFAKCLIAVSISTSLGSRKAYRLCNQLITAIVLHPHKILLRPLPDLWLSLLVMFVPYRNCAFCLDPNPAMSSRGTRTRARTT